MPVPTLLARALAAAESSAYLARIAFALEHADGGVARARLRRNGSNANRAGFVHGGAIASAMLAASELAAASSERTQHDADLWISTLSVSFLDSVRADVDVVTSADVVRRGRDVVHVRAQCHTEAGAPVAAALLAYRVSDPVLRCDATATARSAAGVSGAAGRLAGSPYMGAMGAEMLDGTREWSCMSLPLRGNEGAAGHVHDGAVVGLVDTCAALASFLRHGDEARVASSTVSLSIAWTSPVRGDVRAGARLVGQAGATCTSEAEVWTVADGVLRATAVVCYRMRRAHA